VIGSEKGRPRSEADGGEAAFTEGAELPFVGETKRIAVEEGTLSTGTPGEGRTGGGRRLSRSQSCLRYERVPWEKEEEKDASP